MSVVRVLVSFQPKTLEKLDRVRGDMPRSTFLSMLIKGLKNTKEANGSP